MCGGCKEYDIFYGLFCNRFDLIVFCKKKKEFYYVKNINDNFFLVFYLY